MTKNPIKLNQKYQASIHYPLTPVIDFESLRRLKIKRADLGDYHYDLVLQHALKTMESELATNLYSATDKKGFYGYVKCSLGLQKQKTRYWELIPSILTCCYYNICGGPIAHTTLEREYQFDIYDAVGNKVSSYTFKGSGKNQHGLYSNTNFDGTEMKAFRSALKKFEEAAAKDADLINRKLKYGRDEFQAKINRPINDRDLILADWLNSGEMPTAQELDDAIANAPRDYVGWGLRAIYKANNGLLTSALSDIDEYCKLNPACNIIKPYLLKGIWLQKLGRNAEAYEALIISDRLYPGDEYTKIITGSLLCDAGAYNVALDVFKEASRLNPDNPETLQTISQLNKICNELTQQREKADVDESMRRAMSMQIAANASANAMSSLSNLVNNNRNSSYTSSYNTSSYNTSSTKQSSGHREPKTRECSLCNGKGWIAGFNTVSFASSTSYYCEECHREVPSSHSHDQCPSCRGTGKITSIQ